MSDQLDKIFDLPMKTKLGILGGTLAVFIGGYYFLFYQAVQEQLSTLTESIEGSKGLKQQISQKEGIAKNLSRYIDEVKKLDGELSKALAELPDKKEIAQLLAKISDKARDSGLEIQLFKPQPEQKKDFYSEVPVEIKGAGTFHQVATFFDEVGRLERIVNLSQFGIADPDVQENRVSLQTSVLATSFRFLDESERPQPDEEGAGKRRRGGAAKAKTEKEKKNKK